jgi:TonB family protein
LGLLRAIGYSALAHLVLLCAWLLVPVDRHWGHPGDRLWPPATLPLVSLAVTPPEPSASPVRAVDEPTSVEYRSLGDSDREAAHPSAPSAAPNPDPRAGEAAASGGDGTGAPTLVTGRADAATLRTQPRDAERGYQLQRIASDHERSTRESARVTPHPSGTPWLSSVAGAGHARHAPTVSPPSADSSGRADERLSDNGDPARVKLAAWQAERIRRRALERAALAAATASREAPGFQRPALEQGPAATEADTIADRVADRIDSALVSSELVPAKLEMSRPTSPGVHDDGRGAGTLGFAAEGRGSAPVPTGAPGLPDAKELALASYRRAYEHYLSRLKQKVDPLWEFPRDLAMRMEQGDVLVAFTIRKDGSVKDVHVIKGSGFPTFDRNVLRAIKKAAPFEPLPATFGSELTVTAPFEGSNPAIR